METIPKLKVAAVPSFRDICGCGHPSSDHMTKTSSDYVNTGKCTTGTCDCDGFHRLVEQPAVVSTITVNPKSAKIIKLMFDELEKADKKYPHDKMSRKELKCSLATVKCEFEELKRETKRKKRDMNLMQKEAIQLLAMAFKFNRDVIFERD
jgi:hypothetical protein